MSTISDNSEKPAMKKSQKLLLSGAVILAAGNILVKVIGALLKVPLQRILTDSGMAYYNVANDIYVWLYMVSTAGLPVAISLLTSEARGKGNVREAKKIFGIALRIFLVVGLVGMSVMAFGRGLFARSTFDDASYAILAISPTLFFICISSAYRGYFQGYQNMVPTAVSELIEALGKLVIGIALALYAVKRGYPPYIVAAYTLVGLTIGVALGMFYLVFAKYFFKSAAYDREFLRPESAKMKVRSSKELLKAILVVGIPITISASTMSFTNVLDNMILTDRLYSIGFSEAEASVAFGNYKTCAVTLFNLPPVLIYPISASLIPFLSSAIASGSRKAIRRTMDSSLRLTSVIALPCAVGLSVLSEPILRLLFPAESAKRAAPLLSVLAIGIVFLSILSVTNAFLQSHKHETLPIVSTVSGAVVKLLSTFIFVGIPSIGMLGAPIGTCLCYFTTMMLNLIFIAKYVNYIPNIRRVFLAPILSAAACGLTAALSYAILSKIHPGGIVTILSIGLAALVYAAAIFLLRGITEEDLKMVPKGALLISLLKKAHLLR